MIHLNTWLLIVVLTNTNSNITLHISPTLFCVMLNSAHSVYHSKYSTIIPNTAFYTAVPLKVPNFKLRLVACMLSIL